MAEDTVPICRLCLEVVYDGRFEEAESIIIVLQNVLPDLDFTVSSRPLVCRKCVETLQKSFNFKSACLETEKQLQDYRPGGSTTVQLDEMVQIKCSENEVKMEKTKKDKICRFCLQILEGELSVQLGVIEQDMLQKCLPELDLTVSQNPVICATCLECLQSYFNFVMSCSDVEQRIQNYCTMQGTNSNDQVNLHDVILVSVKQEDKFNCDDTGGELLRSILLNAHMDVKMKSEENGGSNIVQSMETEEVFIKDEVSTESIQEANFDTFDEDSSRDWSEEDKRDGYEEKLPHELDHDYITNRPPLNNGLTNTSHLSKSYKMKHFIKPRKESQTLHVLKRTIVRLERKLKYYQDLYQKASNKLHSIQHLLQELRSKNLISEEVYQEIMSCK